MTSNKSRTVQLEKAMRERNLVSFYRRYEDFAVRGYVVAVGPKFFLFLIVSDRIWFDGFECFRISDVLNLQPDPYATFMETALKKRGDRRPRKPHVCLESIEKILLSASRSSPLVTVHCEKIDPDVCHIGRVVGIARGRVALLKINPAAIWDIAPTEYRLAEITRVSFGGDYEEALSLVGGAADRCKC